jgi:hypothetical protein
MKRNKGLPAFLSRTMFSKLSPFFSTNVTKFWIALRTFGSDGGSGAELREEREGAEEEETTGEDCGGTLDGTAATVDEGTKDAVAEDGSGLKGRDGLILLGITASSGTSVGPSSSALNSWGEEQGG